jgi:hypothetical protein
MDSEKRFWIFSGNMAVYGKFERSSAPTLNICRSRPAVIWSEEVSPYRRIARITVKPQLAWSEARSSAVDDGLLFAPWHGLAAHRPLGGIMRVRKAVYEEAKKFRAERNGRVIQEPREMVAFGD